jgi:hypothetical protein
VAASFQLELENLISHDTPRSAILSGTVGADVPSLRTILEILSGNGSVYVSNDIDYYTPPCMCYYIDGEVLPGEVLGLTSPD